MDGSGEKFFLQLPSRRSAPFITSLGQGAVLVLEDRLIEHDASFFPGMRAVRRYIVGAVEIETPSSTLTIVNANRGPIEETLGVDLLYYSHRFRSFVLVQYKRLRSKDRVYRPESDASYQRELSRMRRFGAEKGYEATTGVDGFRLSQQPFYFKLCDAVAHVGWSDMAPGMYLPLDLWELTLTDPRTLGPRGGVRFSRESVSRALTNTDFARLVGQGWIGSGHANTAILEGLVASLLKAGHSLVLGVNEPRPDQDYERDELGRFR